MKRRYQKTISQEIRFEGRGIHGGKNSLLICSPAKEGSGLTFKKSCMSDNDSLFIPSSNTEDLSVDTDRSSSLSVNNNQFNTIEHFMAAVWAVGITNMRIELEGDEVPILDGSALPFFCEMDRFSKTQSSVRDVYSLREPVFASGALSSILAIPHDGFKVSYTLDYKYDGLRSQTVSYSEKEDFSKTIGLARTFCTQDEAEALQGQGYGKGATTENTIVVGKEGLLEGDLRIKDECARHKILDLIGDLALMNMDLNAHLIAIRSGHFLNHKIRKMICKQIRMVDGNFK